MAGCLLDEMIFEALLGCLGEARSRSSQVVEVNSVCWRAESKHSDRCSVGLFAPASLVNRKPVELLRLLAMADDHLASLVCPDGG